jgi:Peptidase family S41/Tricorn protease C1 domain
MKRRYVIGAWVALIVVMTSCESILFDDDPKSTPVTNFDLLWSDFDKTYSFFELKKMNWDSVYQVYRPKVNSSTSNYALFQIMSDMLATLKDGHVNLYMNNQTNFSYDFTKGKPVNFPGFPSIASKYVTNYQSNGVVGFGSIGANVGYIIISSFGSSSTSDKYYYIDAAIEKLGGKKGLIIDVRSNGGGSDINASIISSRFMDQKRLFRYLRYRNGRAHNNFTDFMPDYIDKDGEKQFTGSVIILTNRSCFSSTEGFILQMKTMPNVMMVGDTTGGGSGNPIARELPNGWTYRFSRWIVYKSDKTTFEGKGLIPDVPVWIGQQDRDNGVDTILEKAIQMLQ